MSSTAEETLPDYRTFALEFPTPTIGGLIRGLDLRSDLDSECREELRRALAERGVLFLPGQPIRPSDHVRFASIFGAVRSKDTFFPRLDDNPDVEVLEGRGESIGTDVWHTDVSWHPKPAVATCLHAQEIPPVGGDTLWASMTAAYASLSPRMKELIADLTAIHTWEKSIADYVRKGPDGDEGYRRQRAAFPPVEHRVVQRHPTTGLPLIYVNELFTTSIVGLPRQEGSALLELLTGLPKVPEHQVRLRWEPQTVVIWDNRAVQHYAVTDYRPHYRRLHRITVRDDAAAFTAVG